jgi:hypothetical protein
MASRPKTTMAKLEATTPDNGDTIAVGALVAVETTGATPADGDGLGPLSRPPPSGMSGTSVAPGGGGSVWVKATVSPGVGDSGDGGEVGEGSAVGPAVGPAVGVGVGVGVADGPGSGHPTTGSSGVAQSA